MLSLCGEIRVMFSLYGQTRVTLFVSIEIKVMFFFGSGKSDVFLV